MFEHRDPSRNSVRTYEIDANTFDLCEGDTVASGYEIGTDVRSGAPVFLSYRGQIATVYYNPMNDSYLIMIILLNDDDSANTTGADELILNV